MPLDNIANLEIWVAHLNAQGLSFVGACNSAAVIVRQNNNGATLQIGSKDSLTRGVEVIAVGKGKHRALGFFYNIGNHAPYHKLIF